ncbi:MAG: right-handed parallel beta-helix repeat-containing protein [Verrucomicrobiaceae bacterium]|nr:right-handed parallel beta-helix repeat-containing protein [Verrucomicrobiaceae bacterium]
MIFRLLCLAAFSAASAAHALTSAELQRFIDDAAKSKSGGEVVIPPGTHVLERTLMITDAKKLRIAGLDAERTVLRLPPLAFAECGAAARAGDSRIQVKKMQQIVAGMRLHIEADGETDSFTKKPRPYHRAIVKSAAGGHIELQQPLQFDCPPGTFIRDADAPNIFELRGTCEDIQIDKLTLDGGRVDGDPPVRGHAQLCGILAQGKYSYEDGPQGPRVKNLRVDRCFIQNCHGRGIALYACENVLIENCTLRDTTDEAIDFDHFTTGAIARHNHIARSLVGVELNDASGCRVEQNDFLACQTGINLWRWCKQPGLNEDNVISGNQFDRTTGNAVQIATGTAKNTISANTITDSGKNGIIISGQDQIVRENVITRSGMKSIVIQGGRHQVLPPVGATLE